MKIQEFVVTKKTGTYADPITAAGLACMLHYLSDQEVIIDNSGGQFIVRLSEGVSLEDLDITALQRDPLFKYLLVPKDNENPPQNSSLVFNYEKEKMNIIAYREQRAVLRKAKGKDFTDQDENELKERFAYEPNFYLYQQIYVLGNHIAYNKLFLLIQRAKTEDFVESVRLKLAGLASGKDPKEIDTPFAPKVAAVQAFNPAVGKGVNRSKPDSTSLAAIPGVFVDWFEEWLRYIGLFYTGNAYLVGDDTKFVSIVPQHISFEDLKDIYKVFLDTKVPWNSKQIDILSVLELAKFLVNRSGSRLLSWGKRPQDVVAGIQVGYFKSLGSSKAHFNSSFIGLPGWFPIGSKAEANEWLEVFNEHSEIIKNMDEDKSEEASMLGEYRDYISSGETLRFLRFLGNYSQHVMRMMSKNQYVRLFSEKTLRRVVMGDHNYSEIVNNEGFLAVAHAIRNATIWEQYQKSKGKQIFEIHYGLIPELKQKARFGDQFIAAVCEFIADYNKENARYEELIAKRPREKVYRRKSVSQNELEQFIQLAEKWRSNPEPLAMMLLAFGTASKGKQEEGEKE